MKSPLNVLFVLSLLLGCTSLKAQKEEINESITRGSLLYKNLCAGCHKPDGSGYTEKRLTPPLAKSDYLMKNKSNGITAVLFGLKGKIIVNNVEYDRVMPLVPWTDQEISDVLNFVRNSWGNKGDFISKTEVAKLRAKEKVGKNK